MPRLGSPAWLGLYSVGQLSPPLGMVSSSMSPSSQTLPTPSPSESNWLLLATVGQLSHRSPNPSSSQSHWPLRGDLPLGCPTIGQSSDEIVPPPLLSRWGTPGGLYTSRSDAASKQLSSSDEPCPSARKSVVLMSPLTLSAPRFRTPSPSTSRNSFSPS